MVDSVRQFYERIGVEAVLDRHTLLRIVPSRADDLWIAGPLPFHATGPSGVVDDQYQIELCVSPAFPSVLPKVWETGDRIPRDYHKLVGNSLCLGAPTEVRLKLARKPTLLTLVDRLVIPYLYGYSIYEKTKKMPFGELRHGDEGIRQHLSEIFGGDYQGHPEEFLRLASLKRRVANKHPCPCESGRRLGRCHNRSTNHMRRKMGRRWFRSEYVRVIKSLDNPTASQKKQITAMVTRY